MLLDLAPKAYLPCFVSHDDGRASIPSVPRIHQRLRGDPSHELLFRGCSFLGVPASSLADPSRPFTLRRLSTYIIDVSSVWAIAGFPYHTASGGFGGPPDGPTGGVAGKVQGCGVSAESIRRLLAIYGVWLHANRWVICL